MPYHPRLCLSVVSTCVLLLLSACAPSPMEKEVGVTPAGPPAEVVVYDYTQFDYTYARAVALQRTHLEPAPTSYVLFPAPLRPEDRQRVEAYCLEHYRQFEDLGDVYEADPFGNVVTFYWPLSDEDEAVRATLEAGNADRCAFLEEHYDYGRAEALLATLEGGAYSDSVGPVLVLDLGFEAVVAPFDNVDTEDVDRIPPIWKQAIDDALKEARRSREEMIELLESLEEDIEELEATASDPDAKRRERREAEERLEEKRKSKRGLLRRIFGKNSWGRAVLCGFSGTVLQLAGPTMLSTEPIKAKLDQWCSFEPS